jgi:DNA/RNA endonuclease G (NUC1)
MKRYIVFFSAGTVTGLFVSSVIDRLKIKSSSRIPKNPYLNFVKFGLPSSDNLEYYQQYITSIDYARRIPSWVGYSLSRDYLSKCSFQPTSTRARSEFKSECQIVPKQFQATNEDYFDSGWSRGHMAPAGDHKYGIQSAIDETFILSANIVPQDLDNNGNYWYRIEWFARELAKKFDFVHIITGPLFIPIDRIQSVSFIELYSPNYLCF